MSAPGVQVPHDPAGLLWFAAEMSLLNAMIPLPTSEATMPTKPAHQLSEKVLAEMPQDAAPEGTQAAPGDFVAKLRKALPHILTGLMEVGAVAADGQLSADEVKELAGKVFEFVRGLRTQGG